MVLSPLLNDFWTAARRLARTPAYSALLVITLGLGIGTHAAVFRIAHVVLFPEQSFTDGSRVVSIELYRRGLYTPLLESHVASLANQTIWFECVESIRTAQMTWRRGESARRLSTASVTPSLPSRMGASVVLGRGLLVNEGGPADEAVVVISEGLWRRDFGAAADVIGTTMVLDDVSRTVIGVVRSTPMYSLVDVWIPTVLDRDGNQRVTAFAWLRPHVTPRVAGITGSSMGFEGSDTKLEVRLVQPTQRADSTAGRTLVLLRSASAFVLAIICANFAMLLMTRNLSRQREISTCAALGASRARILRPLLFEGLVLGLAGGALGVFVADWCTRTLLWLRPRSLALLYPDSIPLDAQLIAYTILIASVIGLIIGTLSTVAWTRSDLIRGAGRHDSFPVQHGVRRLLAGAVIVETALAVILVTGTTSMLVSFLRLRSADPGFEPESIAELGVDLDSARYPEPAVRRGFLQDVAARITRIDGVTEATLASDAPPHSLMISGEIEVEDQMTASRPPVDASWIHVASNYFRVLRIPILAGRTFSDADGKGAVIVSESFARRYWGPGGRAVGERFRLRRPNGAKTSYDIVGIAGDVFGRGLRDRFDEIYLPYAIYGGARATVLARTAADARHLLPLMKAQLWSVDPNVPDSDVGTLTGSMAASIDEQPFYLALFGFFACLAIALATLGVSGVAAHVSAARRVEYAVHLALGAQRSDIERMVIRQGLISSLIGTGLGVVGAVILSDAMRAVIRDVGSTTPLIYGFIALTFALLSLWATWLPARRAARVEPAYLLRR